MVTSYLSARTIVLPFKDLNGLLKKSDFRISASPGLYEQAMIALQDMAVFNGIYANLVILQYVGSPFTWDKVFMVLRPLPNHIKNQRFLDHTLYYFLFNYILIL